VGASRSGTGAPLQFGLCFWATRERSFHIFVHRILSADGADYRSWKKKMRDGSMAIHLRISAPSVDKSHSFFTSVSSAVKLRHSSFELGPWSSCLPYLPHPAARPLLFSCQLPNYNDLRRCHVSSSEKTERNGDSCVTPSRIPGEYIKLLAPVQFQIPGRPRHSNCALCRP
jgi:hypothetical protein